MQTSYGRAETKWSRDAAGRLTIDVTVPVNTRADVHVPIKDGQQVLEGGKPAGEQPGVTRKGTSDGVAAYEVGSGSYRFLAAEVMPRARRPTCPRPSRGTLALTLWQRQLGTLRPASPATTRRSRRHGHLDRRRRRARVHDPSANSPGHLVNGAPRARKRSRSRARRVRPGRGASNPTPLLS